MTSGKKVAKVARKVFRKEQVKLLQDSIRPKPKLIPWPVYIWLLGLFLKLDK